MANWFKSRATGRLSLTSAATLLIASSFLGQILGFLRTKLVNANFSAVGPHSTDTYFAAFNIPDFFFYTLAAGALGVAFMPVLAERLERGDRKGMWELSSSLLNLLAIVMGVVAIIVLVFANQLIHYIVAPDLSPAQLHTAATIMRFLALNPLLFTISGILASSQQSMGRFFFFAIAPLFYNTSIIVSTMVFSEARGHYGGPGHLGIEGLGIGALIGAVLQLLVIAVGVLGLRFRWQPKIMWRNQDFRVILRNLPPRSIDQGMDQIESIVETNFARRLGEGNISYYYNAYILQTAPIILIGTAISTAAFPRLTNRLAQGRPDLFRRDFLMVLRAMIWIILPVAILCFFCRGYLARLIFANDAPVIARIFGYLTGAIIFRTLYAIISRWFYAQKDTRTPLYVSLFSIGLNVVLVYLFSKPSAYGVEGLAMAQSLVAMVEVFALLVIMIWRDHRLFTAEFWSDLTRIFSVTGFTVITAYIMISLVPLETSDKGFITLTAKVLFIVVPTLVVHIAISSLFGLDEVRPVIRKLRKLVLTPVRIQ